MARNFLAYPTAPYQGTLSSKAFNDGRGRQKGLMVGATIPWALYTVAGAPLGNANPNFAVAFNLNTAGPNTVSGSWDIQSVYIDNEGVDFPVYVYFEDTFFTVSCPANSAGWYQVFTSGRQALITAIGITDAAIAAAQMTRVFFTDTYMSPSLDQEIVTATALWLASPTLARVNLNSVGFGVPSLGDQADNTSMFASGVGTSAQVFVPAAGGSLPPSKFIIVNALLMNLLQDGIITDNNSIDLVQQGSAIGLYTWTWQSQLNVKGNLIMPEATGMNLKLDGTKNYFIRQSAGSNCGDQVSLQTIFTQSN